MKRFESQLDIWKYLLVEGNAVTPDAEWETYYKFHDGSIHEFDKKTNKEVRGNSRSFYVVNVAPYEIPKVVEWWENIPKTGVLCWVSDDALIPKDVVGLVFSKTEFGFKTKDWNGSGDLSIEFDYAVPLTEEEVDDLILRPALEAINVGDLVRIDKAVYKEDGWDNTWNHEEMSPMIGTVDTIVKINQFGYYLKADCGYGFPRGSLVKVK